MAWETALQVSAQKTFDFKELGKKKACLTNYRATNSMEYVSGSFTFTSIFFLSTQSIQNCGAETQYAQLPMHSTKIGLGSSMVTEEERNPHEDY